MHMYIKAAPVGTTSTAPGSSWHVCVCACMQLQINVYAPGPQPSMQYCTCSLATVPKPQASMDSYSNSDIRLLGLPAAGDKRQ